jgi:hypothetical protein
MMQEIQYRLSTGPDCRLLRNNVGMLQDITGQRVRFGLAVGSGDLIGWKTVLVTPDMVGCRLAVFTSIEVKSPTGPVRPEQKKWIAAVQEAGGFAGVARTVEEARQILNPCTQTK